MSKSFRALLPESCQNRLGKGTFFGCRAPILCDLLCCTVFKAFMLPGGIGSLVLLLHGVTDIFVYLSKARGGALSASRLAVLRGLSLSTRRPNEHPSMAIHPVRQVVTSCSLLMFQICCTVCSPLGFDIVSTNYGRHCHNLATRALTPGAYVGPFRGHCSLFEITCAELKWNFICTDRTDGIAAGMQITTVPYAELQLWQALVDTPNTRCIVASYFTLVASWPDRGEVEKGCRRGGSGGARLFFWAL